MHKSYTRFLFIAVFFTVFSMGSLSAQEQEALTIQPDGSIVILIDGKPQLLTDYLVPVGSIQAFMGEEAPSGWLLCNGSSYDTTEYAELFAILQYRHGGSDTSFSVPDLRGLFLRGADNEAGVDPDAADRISPADDSVVGDVVGSLQTDELKKHGHIFSMIKDSNPSGYNGQYSGNPVAADPGNTGYAPRNAGTTEVGGSETRPKNMSVNYIIKY